MICGEDCYWYRDSGRCNKSRKGYTGFLTRCDDYKCFTPKDKIMEDKKLTKACKVCGKEKPLDEFQKTRTGAYSSTCKKCMSEKIAQAKAEKAGIVTLAEKAGTATFTKMETSVKADKMQTYLNLYSDEEIMEELKNRGYTGTLTKTFAI